ncbi:putative transcriptional regulator [Clostridium beijerinckii]|nr:putative transcriptional regulator [Clostridium beijerinckii]
MYESSSELAENKLLMLYVLKSIKNPISNTQLTEIILENNFINYFTFQQYLSELEESKFVEYHDVNDKKLLILTEKEIMFSLYLKIEYPLQKCLLLMTI